MSFEFFLQMYLWTVTKSAGRRGGCSKWPGQPRQSPSGTAKSLRPIVVLVRCTTSAPLFCRLQLPPADDRRDRGAHICQVWVVAYGLRGEGLVWLIGAMVCLLAANRGSNCSFTWTVDGRIVRCGIISSCQSAATSKIVKRFWSWVRLM